MAGGSTTRNYQVAMMISYSKNAGTIAGGAYY